MAKLSIMKTDAIHVTWSLWGLLTILIVPSYCDWLTLVDQRFSFTCHEDQTLSYLQSTYNTGAKDRQWNFKCENLPVGKTALTDCKWSGYQNHFDQPFSYICDSDRVMIGIESYHDNHAEDRKFQFMCCKPTGYIVHNCQQRGYLNEFRKPFAYTVPKDKVLVGMSSYHDNSKQDRVFKMVVCSMSPAASHLG